MVVFGEGSCAGALLLLRYEGMQTVNPPAPWFSLREAFISPSVGAAATSDHAEVAQSRRARLASSVSVALPLVGAVGGALLGLREGAARGGGLLLLGASVGFAVVRWQLARFFTEEADYEIENSFGPLEIRRYPPQMRAETVVENTTWDRALDDGFRRLARYIFGENDPAIHFQVGTPIFHLDRSRARGVRRSEKIAMTAPVIATIGPREGAADRTIAFVMPAAHEMRTLPTPRDPRVRLCPIPARRVAALPFRGRYGGDLPARKAEELVRRMNDAGLAAQGEVSFAGYDAPTTLPWLRRNEVIVDIDDVAL